MAGKRKVVEVNYPPDGWVINLQYEVSPNLFIEVGDACKIKGEQGQFVFKRHVVNTNVSPEQEWVDVWGGTSGYGSWRSIYTNRLVVPRKKRTDNSKSPTR